MLPLACAMMAILAGDAQAQSVSFPGTENFRSFPNADGAAPEYLNKPDRSTKDSLFVKSEQRLITPDYLNGDFWANDNNSRIQKRITELPRASDYVRVIMSSLRIWMSAISMHEVYGAIVVLVLGAIVSAGGIGGGGVFVSILVLFCDQNLREAVPLSKAMIFCGSLVSFYHSLTRRDPTTGGLYSNWTLVRLFTPGSLLGTSIGIVLNDVFPESLLFSLFALVLFFVTIKTSQASLNLYRSEKCAEESDIRRLAGSIESRQSMTTFGDITKEQVWPPVWPPVICMTPPPLKSTNERQVSPSTAVETSSYPKSGAWDSLMADPTPLQSPALRCADKLRSKVDYGSDEYRKLLQQNFENLRFYSLLSSAGHFDNSDTTTPMLPPAPAPSPSSCISASPNRSPGVVAVGSPFFLGPMSDGFSTLGPSGPPSNTSKRKSDQQPLTTMSSLRTLASMVQDDPVFMSTVTPAYLSLVTSTSPSGRLKRLGPTRHPTTDLSQAQHGSVLATPIHSKYYSASLSPTVDTGMVLPLLFSKSACSEIGSAKQRYSTSRKWAASPTRKVATKNPEEGLEDTTHGDLALSTVQEEDEMDVHASKSSILPGTRRVGEDGHSSAAASGAHMSRSCSSSQVTKLAKSDRFQIECLIRIAGWSRKVCPRWLIHLNWKYEAVLLTLLVGLLAQTSRLIQLMRQGEFPWQSAVASFALLTSAAILLTLGWLVQFCALLPPSLITELAICLDEDSSATQDELSVCSSSSSTSLYEELVGDATPSPMPFEPASFSVSTAGLLSDFKTDSWSALLLNPGDGARQPSVAESNDQLTLSFITKHSGDLANKTGIPSASLPPSQYDLLESISTFQGGTVGRAPEPTKASQASCSLGSEAESRCGDMQFEVARVLLVPAISVFSGILSGLLGVGGGMVTAPLFVYLQLPPMCAVATASTSVMFTSTSTTIQFYLIGRLNVLKSIPFGVLTVLASQTGQKIVYFTSDYGRPSYVLFVVTAALLLSTILTLEKAIQTCLFPKP